MTSCRLAIAPVVLTACFGAPRGDRPREPAVPALPAQLMLGCTASIGDAKEPAVALRAAGGVTCALTENRRIVCWGMANHRGQLSSCGASDLRSPIVLPLPPSHSLALSAVGVCSLSNQRVFCTEGVHRALGGHGDGEIVALRQSRAVAVGSTFVCGATADTVRCLALVWQPGEPAIRLHRLAVSRARDLEAGDKFACVLDDDGAVWCWEQGPWVDAPTPMRITGLPPVRSLSLGSDDQLCATTPNDTVYCSPLVRGRRPMATKIAAPPIQSVRHGLAAVCGVDAMSAVHCVGALDNFLGGAPPAFSRRVRQISASAALCGLLDDGSVECLGASGLLGDGAGSAQPDRGPRYRVDFPLTPRRVRGLGP